MFVFNLELTNDISSQLFNLRSSVLFSLCGKSAVCGGPAHLKCPHVHPSCDILKLIVFNITLVSIFYFYIRFNLHLHWTTTNFILSLAFAELLYCIINLPMTAMQLFYQRWIFGETLCFAIAAFRHINAFADWMSIGTVSYTHLPLPTTPYV